MPQVRMLDPYQVSLISPKSTGYFQFLVTLLLNGIKVNGNLTMSVPTGGGVMNGEMDYSNQTP
jgi:hypothetical protein